MYFMLKLLFFTLFPALACATVHLGYNCQYFSLQGEKSGLINGFIFEIDYLAQNNCYLGLRTELNGGNLQGKTYYGYKTNNLILDKTIEGRIGYAFCNRWTPFCGLSFYDLSDKWHNGGTVSQFQTISLPLGIAAAFPLTPCTTFSLLLQVNAMLYGRWFVKGHAALSDLSRSLQKRPFYLIETPLDYWYEGVNLKLVPFARFGTFAPDIFQPIRLRTFGGRIELGLAY